MMRKTILLAALVPLVSGCVAKAAWDVATLPVKAGAKAVDLATVSSKERDEHYAHEQRKRAEQRKKAEREDAQRQREIDKRAAKRDRENGVDRDLN